MHRAPRHLNVLLPLIFGLVAGSAFGQVFSSEFFFDPQLEGWDLWQEACGPRHESADGWYIQDLDLATCGPPGGAQVDWVGYVTDWNGVSDWFLEFRVSSTGPSSELPGQAPATMTAANSYDTPILYGFTVSADEIKFKRDLDVVLFFPVAQKPHRIRLETYNGTVNTYRWYLDGELIYEGIAPHPFPSGEPRISWRGKAWYLPNLTSWDFIRFGVPGVPGTGDYDGSGTLDKSDLYFFEDCRDYSHPNEPFLPGCDFADLDQDDDVDFHDFGLFQLAFNGE